MPIAVADRIVPSPAAPQGESALRETKGVASKPSPPAPDATPSPFARLVHALGKEAERGESMVRGVLHGNTGGLGAPELLALQAGIYRYGETVDLAAKLVDKAGTDLKTVIGGQQ
jgi:hypothetical protein